MKKSKITKKVGLALGGGGARGFCHIGILQVLKENGIPIDVVSGCSIGAIVGGCYAAGVPLEKMEEIAKKFNRRIITDFNITLSNQGLFKGKRISNFLKKLTGDIKIEECIIPFSATCVNIMKPELVVINKGSLTDAMRASMGIPAAFQSCKIDDYDCLIDGGILERVPINAAKNLGADVVIGVDVLGVPQEIDKISNVLEMINRAYMVLDWEANKEKVKECDVLITPDQGNKLIYDFKNNAVGIEIGRDAASNVLPEIFELLKDNGIPLLHRN